MPLMLLLLAGVFYITLFGANMPSEWLSTHLLALGTPLAGALAKLGLPPFVVSMLTDGLWRVLATVVSVMLPPMAIFFPLFTLLEDAGYLPRVAFQLDHAFQCARASGKQSLTMCMGFGVQRLRRDRLPHHRLAAGAADRPSSPTALRRATDGFRCLFSCARCSSRAARQAARCC